MLRRLMVCLGACFMLFAVAVPAASADHGEGHNGETMELSKSEDIGDGESVEVTLTSFLPDASITVVTCFVYPAAGPTDCELSNYGQFATAADGSGSATLDYVVSHVPDKCDASSPCFIVAADGFGPAANYAAVEVSFAAGDTSEEPAAEPEPADEPEPTDEPTAEPEPAEEPEPTPEPEPTAEPEQTQESEPDVDDSSDTTETASVPNDDDDGGSSTLTWLIPVIAVVAIAGAGAAYAMNKRGGASS